MKRAQSIPVVLALSFMTHAALADINCMDNSYHLTQKFDHKAYHYVETCLCPCEAKYKLGPRGQCSQCMHYRIPETSTFVTDSTLRLRLPRDIKARVKKRKKVCTVCS